MAAEDFGPVLGKPVEIVTADHQNKADVASGIARVWYDTEGVDMITDGGSSAVALAVEDVSRQKQKLVLFTGPASSDITGKNCSPYAAHWTYDTYALSTVTGSAVVKAGGKNWFFIGADYAFGHALERDTAAVVEKDGGKVLGAVYAPLNRPDFSSFLLQAQASKADIIGLANAGGDTTTAIKQGTEFGITKGGQKFAALLMFITDVHALGLNAAQGLQFTTAFYWDKDDESRAFSQRFIKEVGHMPTMVQAGVYSATMHYLKAVKALGNKDPLKVMEKMRETPINDFMTHDGKLRIDGRVLRDMYLVQVKKPEESKGAMGLSENRRDRAGRQGLPSARRWRLLVGDSGEAVTPRLLPVIHCSFAVDLRSTAMARSTAQKKSGISNNARTSRLGWWRALYADAMGQR